MIASNPRSSETLSEGSVISRASASSLVIVPDRAPHATPTPAGMVRVERRRVSAWGRAAKRSIDLLGASIGLVLAAPLLLLVAVAIKTSSRGPVLFRQLRVGMDGRLFELCKLRTMNVDAEEQLGSLLDRNEAPSPLFKMHDDPRVTRVGWVLRRFSIDELPQLWNVLRGQMSLVGPRPALQTEMAGWRTDSYDRLRAKPGITGCWQIRSGGTDTFDDYVRLDRYYVDNWSLALDLRILGRTIPPVLFGRRSPE